MKKIAFIIFVILGIFGASTGFACEYEWQCPNVSSWTHSCTPHLFPTGRHNTYYTYVGNSQHTVEIQHKQQKGCSQCSGFIWEKLRTEDCSVVVTAGIAETCTAEGLTEGKSCSVCGETFVAQEIVPAKGHTEVIDEAVSPTCTETGLTEGKHCSVCGEVLIMQEIIEALGHTPVETEGFEATDFNHGRTAGTYCSVCEAAIDGCEIIPAFCVIEDGVLTKYNGTTAKLVIPDNLGITEIGNSAFMPNDGFNTTLTSVVIPEGVTTIGALAFGANIALENVVIPKSVLHIEDMAFKSCEKLDNVILPEGLETIGMDAFGRCRGLTSIAIPEGITRIEQWAFFDCDSLKSIQFPSTLVYIGEEAFCTEYGNMITSIVLPDGLKKIESGAFYGWDHLERIIIPDSVTGIGDSAFDKCTNLTQITFSGNVVPEIGSDAIPAGVTIVCKKGSSVEAWAVDNGYAIEYLDADDEPTAAPTAEPTAVPTPEPTVVPTAEPTASPAPDTISGVCGANGDNVVWELDNNGTLTISGEGAMKDYPFYGYGPWYSNQESITTVVIKPGVTSVGQAAFSHCSSLANVTIPEGVTSIGGAAFSHCSSLTSVTIPEGVTSLGGSAFSSCSSLTSVTIPDSIVSTSTYVFYGCNNLTAVYAGSLEGWLSIEFGAFDSNPVYYAHMLYIDGELLTNAVIPEGITSIGNYIFSGCNSLISVTIPEGVTSIGNRAFYECDSLTSVSIPDSITSIGERAFYACNSLTSVTIPEGVTSIRDYAFGGCDSLTSVSIPDSVTSIGYSAFGCHNLKTLVIFGQDMPSVGKDAFGNCSPTVYCYEISDADYWAFENGYETVYLDRVALPLTLSLPADCVLTVGQSLTVVPKLFPEQDDTKITWTSSNSEIVSVEDGVLTALGVGEAAITATSGSGSDSMTVTTYGEVSSFDIPQEIWLETKTTAQLTIENVQPVGATSHFNYESSDTAMLTASVSGLLTGVRPGDAVITVTSGNGVVRTCTVHVCYPVSAIELDPISVSLRAGETAQLTATAITRTQTFENKLVTFASSDEAVVTVDESGLITAVSHGVAAVTVSASSGVKVECAVVVRKDEALELPANLIEIEDEAFAGAGAEKIIIPEGCKSIASRAFADCANLYMIVIPKSVTAIDFDAFENSPGVTIHGVSGSRAEVYARVLGIPFVAQ